MWIHTCPAQAGDSQEEAGAYTGYLALTRTQRVMSMAYGEQVLISGATAELCRGELPEGTAVLAPSTRRCEGRAREDRTPDRPPPPPRLRPQ